MNTRENSTPNSEEKMKSLLKKWDLKLKLNIPFLETELNFQNADKKAAWELYVELLTRITTQPLSDDSGVEKTALESVYALFSITREILKKYGAQTTEFSKIAIPVLNQIIRPFTAKWHKLSEEGNFSNPDTCRQFREELQALQEKIKRYTGLLSEVAGVENLTELERNEPN